MVRLKYVYWLEGSIVKMSIVPRLIYFVVAQSPSRVQLCASVNCGTPGFPVLHYLLELLKLMSTVSVMPSNHLVPFSCLQSFPASGSFLIGQLFTSGGQNTVASASASDLPMNIQGWFPSELTGLISLLSKELSRVFNTTDQKHQFFSAQLSFWSNSHIHIWLLGKP